MRHTVVWSPLKPGSPNPQAPRGREPRLLFPTLRTSFASKSCRFNLSNVSASSPLLATPNTTNLVKPAISLNWYKNIISGFLLSSSPFIIMAASVALVNYVSGLVTSLLKTLLFSIPLWEKDRLLINGLSALSNLAPASQTPAPTTLPP